MSSSATLGDGIRGLSRPDLELLLDRRPDAARALGLKGFRPTVSHLAAVLAERTSIRRAVDSLDLFLLQLLRVACWFGPQVPGALLEAQADGVAPAEVQAGVAELARWGLAFLQEDGSGGWRLAAPGCVRVEVPPALGRRIAELLAGEPAESIRSMLIRLGVQAPRPCSRASLMTLLTERLSDADALRAMLAGAPNAARTVLEAFLAAGGWLTWDAMARHGIRFAGHSGTADESAAGVAWLRMAGLLVVTPATAWQLGAGLSVPGEVQLALRDGVVFRGWDSKPPAVKTRPAEGHHEEPAAVVSAVQLLLDEWGARPPRAIQKGGAGVRDLRKAAKTIAVDERHAQFLYALAIEAGLLEYRDELIVPSPTGERWQGARAPEQWSALLTAWRGASLWREPHGLVALDEAAFHGDGIAEQRAAILGALAELPPGEGAEPRAVARLVYWRHPGRMRSEEAVRVVVEGMGEALEWLGAGTAGPVVALLDPARSALTDPGWARTPHAASFFPEAVATLTVQPDLTILVPGRPSAGLSQALSRFAELQAAAPARIWRLTEASIRAALDEGMEAGEILDVLERHAAKTLPQAVRYLVEDVGRRHGRLVAGRGGLFVRSEDPAIVAAVVADRRLTRLRPRLLAPTVAAFAEPSLPKLLKALRAAGYMPVADESHDGGGEDLGVEVGWPDPASPRGRLSGRHAILARHGRARTPDAPAPDEIRRIAAAVAADATRVPAPGSAWPAAGEAAGDALLDGILEGRICRSPRDIRRLVELAVEHSMSVEIQYVSGRSESSVRTIEPAAWDRSSVTGRCRLRQDNRTFWISRIRWARATGERFEPDLKPPGPAGFGRPARGGW